MGQLALLFDLDGVLVHSMPLHTLAWEKYLAQHGIEVEDVEGSMHGKRNPELVRSWFGDDLPDAMVLEHGAAKERLFREMLVAEGLDRYRVPGVREFLERHPDIPKAIGSNAEIANIDFILDRYGLRKHFGAVINGFEVQRPKPFPDIYLRAAKLLGVEPAHCIVFEDSPPGVQAAVSAGMRVVGVETTPTQFDGVDLKIRNFLEPDLEPWLASQMVG
jgi:beta-phosphoglucomutase